MHPVHMSDSKVYFTDMRCGTNDTLLKKTARLIEAAGFDGIDMDRRFVAIKTHFGEYGNLSYLRPNYSKVIGDAVKVKGGIPFLTDTNTLYVGMRKHAVEHLENAMLNGFTPMTTGCQVIIADGLKGTDEVEVPIDGEYVKEAKIGRAIVDADVLVTLSHFKCHEMTGFGGALKNLAMGCASRRGKMEMHAAGKPKVDADACRGCGRCPKVCAQDALTIVDGKAILDDGKCVGCGRCIAVCNFDAIAADCDENNDILNAKIVEYAMAAVRDKPHFHICVISDVSPFCDCHAENDTPVIPDVGILASFDPVALDRACVDLVLGQKPLPGCRLYDPVCKSIEGDLLRRNQPTTNWASTFDHAERMGFGNVKYELIDISRPM